MWENVWNSLISGNVIEAILLALMTIIMVIVKIILIPIGWFFQTFIPPIDDGLLRIGDFFESASTYLSWGLSLVAIPTEVIVIITAYYTMVLSVAISIWVFKIGIVWWRALK